MKDAPHGPDWRANLPTAAPRRGPHPLAVLIGLCVVAALGLGLLWWVQPVRPAAVFGVSASKLPDGSPVPFADADFTRVTADPLQRPGFALPPDATRDQLRTALAAMARHPADRPLVVFLGGAASVTDGRIELAAGAPGADHPRNRLTLTEVLEQVRAAPPAHRLVVLDFRSEQADWVPAAEAALKNVPDPQRLVLFCRGPGERSHASTSRRGAVFVRYWAEAVRGAADGWNADGTRDGRVSVGETAAFVRSRVTRWSERNGTSPQTPWLTGDGADFVLGPATAPTATEAEPAADPSKMLEAWAVQDAWLNDGRADRAPAEFARLQRALLRMERDWLAGQSPDAARRTFDAELANINTAAAATLAPGVPDVLLTAPAPDVAQAEQLRRYLVRNEGVAEPTEKPPAATPSVILAVASADPPPTGLQLKRLAKWLADAEPEPASLSSLLLRRLAVEPVPPDRTARLLRDTVEFEQLSRRVEFVAWGKVGLERAFTQWTATVAFAGSPGFADPATADRTLTELEESLRSLAFAADSHRAAVTTLRRGERVLANSAELDRLQASLVPPQPLPDLNATTLAANTWAKQATEVEAAVRSAMASFQSPELAAVRRKAEGSGAGLREVADLDRVLAFPLIPAKERAELWAARTALASKLDDAVSELDRQDDDDFANGRRVPAWADPREQPPPRTWVPSKPPARPVVESAPNANRSLLLTTHVGWFDHLAHNPVDLPNASAEVTFTGRALDQCRRFGAAVLPSPRLEIQTNGIILTPAKRSASTSVSVRLIGSERPILAAVGVLSPSTEWVTSPPADRVELSPARAVIAERTLTAGPNPEKHPTLRGVLVWSEVGGRAFFKRVGVDASSLANRLDLLVAGGPDSPALPASSLRVRPNGQPVKFALVLSNPTTAPQTVVVQLANPLRETAAITLGAGEKLPLAFPLPAPAPPPTAPPATTPATPGSEYVPAAAEFVLNLLDAKTREVRQSFTLPVRITEPAELLDVREVLFTPASGELAVAFGERVTFGGGDMPVSLTFPEDRNRGLTVTDGKLSGTFMPGQGTLKLYTKRLKFEPTAGRTVTLAVTADGIERAFTFAGEATGEAVVRFQPLTTPRIQIQCDKFTTGTAPLPVKLETDSAPPTATVEVAIGVEDAGQFVADFTQRNIPAKDRTLGVAFDPKGGLTLKATVGDPEPKLPVDRLVGTRVIVARLLDANGKELARDKQAVVFDGRRPQGVEFIRPPARVPADKPLSVRATCDLPVSGVKEVHFFVGKPVNDAPPPAAALIAAKPAGGTNEWTATIPLDGAKGPLDLSVRFTSQAGLVGFKTVTVERVDAAELNRPQPAAVKGKVVEGTLPQPGLTVVLFDDKGKEKAKAKTKDDGSFAFADLPAGKYTLLAEKTSTNRIKRLPLELAAGEEKTVELGLLLK